MSYEDVEAIKQVKARYFRLMDTKDWDGLAGVFTDDVEIDVTSEGGGVTHSVEEYMPFLVNVLGDVTTVHHGHMPEIELTSPTTARAIWSFEDELWWPDGAPLKYMHGYGHYHETYEKTSGRWRIKTMRISRLKRVLEKGVT
jgi:SnoaL-like domain